MIRTAAPVTASLVFGGVILWMLIALPIGILSALRPRSLLDRSAMVFVLIGISASPARPSPPPPDKHKDTKALKKPMSLLRFPTNPTLCFPCLCVDSSCVLREGHPFPFSCGRRRWRCGAVKAAAQSDVPNHALSFLKRHEEEERDHLKIFEGLTGEQAREKAVLPKLPRQWHAMAVHLYGYEALGLELARLLADLRPDLAHILKDEETHVAFSSPR